MRSEAPTHLARRRVATRRAVIGGLAAVCVVLFTAFFRESAGGFLHGVKDTAGSVVAPIESVTNAVVQPFRDGWHWVSGLASARDNTARLERENRELRLELLQQRQDRAQAPALRRLLAIQGSGIDGYRFVNGTVVSKSPSSLFRTARLDVGTADGVRVNSPVVAPRDSGKAMPVLVGLVTAARSHFADVTFVTDPSMQVGATTIGAAFPLGLVKAAPGGDLVLSDVPRENRVRLNDPVITSGSSDPRLPSPYPAGLLIGYVTGVSSAEVDLTRTVQVQPGTNPRSLSTMSVLAPVSPEALRRTRG